MTKLNVTAEPGSHAVIVTREFNAPRALVYKAYTDPALIPQWWGPHDLTTTVDRMDVKKGGVWRYVQRDAQGNVYAFNGVYHHVQGPEQLVHTFEFEGMPGHILLETITFEERDGKTLITDTSVCQSVADRDGLLQSGMEDGAAQSWDRFEAILERLSV